MTRFISSNKKSRRLWATALWLILWQGLSMSVNQRLLLASPAETALRWLELAQTAPFWRSALFSLGHILAGFALALVLGAVGAILSARFVWAEAFLAPPLAVIRAIPVASFVIVALIWIPSRRLSILISLLIALPLLYDAILNGIRVIDPQILEMTRMFRVSRLGCLRAVALPSILTCLSSSARTAMGLAWKSGVAAEVIGIPTGSIGEKLYKAKIYLATPDLFAWTLTIVLLSWMCERSLETFLRLLLQRLERM